jgi:FdrA protein
VIEVDMETLIGKLLSGPVVVVNLGLKQFGASLEKQGVDVVQVDWTPPAGGDWEMMDLLDELL